MTDRIDPYVAQLAGQINQEWRDRESIACPHRAGECLWQHPDTCRQCLAQNRTVVMAVNKGGLKK